MKLVAMWLSLVGFSLAVAGHDVGHGLDSYRGDAYYAWFIGPAKPIKTCLVVSPQFGVSEFEAKRQVELAFTAWAEYQVRKQIAWAMGTIPISSTKLQFQACDSSEDLKFYFGVESESLSSEKSKHDRPFGFTVRTQYDAENNWSKGYIWIAPPSSIEPGIPNWTRPRTLQLILRHEIGHLMGNGHIPNTIMAAELGLPLAWASKAELTLGERLIEIDQGMEVFPCRKCGELFKSEFSAPGQMTVGSLDNAIRFLFGREQVGTAVSYFSKKKDIKLPTGVLTVKDQAGEIAIDLKSESILNNSFSPMAGTVPASFCAVIKSGTNISFGTACGLPRYTYSGFVLVRGKRVPVLITRNLDSILEVMTLPRNEKEKPVLLIRATYLIDQ